MRNSVQVGRRFGKLVATGVRGADGKAPVRCDCGKEKRVASNHLLHGTTLSCGCLLGKTRKRAWESIKIGDRYGRLVVIEAPFSQPGSHQFRMIVKCDCGTVKDLLGSNVVKGDTLSCGCLRSVLSSVRRLSHDASRRGSVMVEYVIWSAMRRRCNNPSVAEYPLYGGRGIGICQRWDSFSSFLADMGPRPSKKHSIDRIDNNGNYGPTNCRWATQKEQARNKTTNLMVTAFGQTKAMSAWIEDLGIEKPWTAYRRLRAGIDPEVFLGSMRTVGILA